MRHPQSRSARLLPTLTLSLLLAAAAEAGPTQLIVGRDTAPAGEIKGTVDLTIVPDFDDARVTVTVDGQKIAEGLRAPWRIPIDFGPLPVEHKIVVTALGDDHKRVQWQTTINKGHQTLRVKIEPVDAANRVFEANVTAPEED